MTRLLALTSVLLFVLALFLFVLVHTRSAKVFDHPLMVCAPLPSDMGLVLFCEPVKPYYEETQ